MKQICIECNKPYTSDDLLFCPDCATKQEPTPTQPEKELSEEEFYNIISKSKKQQEPIENYCLFCRGGGCPQCTPKNYL